MNILKGWRVTVTLPLWKATVTSKKKVESLYRGC